MGDITNLFSFTEMAYMCLVLGEANGNASSDMFQYREKFSTRIVPDRRTFLRIDRSLRGTGMTVVGSYTPKQLQ
jgi:hypothetical protein